MLKISGKMMEEKLKIGWTISDFAIYLQVSEETFLECLKKTFSQRAFSQMNKRLKNNQKRKDRKHSSSNNTKERTTSQPTTPSLALTSLKKQEENLVAIVCKLEGEHSQLFSNKAILKSIFQKQKQELSNLAQELERRKAIVNDAYEKWLKISSEMHSISEALSKNRKLLHSVREEIKAAENVSIFVYDNGEIEIENYSITDVAHDSDAIFHSLLENEIVESIPLKNIRQLSKLIALTQDLKQNNLVFEITFEDAKMNEVFKILQLN